MPDRTTSRSLFGPLLLLVCFVSVPEIVLSEPSTSDTTDQAALRQSLSRIISVDLQNVTLDSALQEVSRKSGVPFNYSHSRLPLTRTVSIKKDSASAYDVMRMLLGLVVADIAVVGDGQLAVVPLTQPSAQIGAIAGVVMDRTTGAVIPGATVLLVDLYRSLSTDSSGHFGFSGLYGGRYTLSVSHIGYITRQLDNISLDADTIAFVRVLLSSKAVLLPSITVSPGTFAIMETGAPVTQSLTREDIQTTAQFGEDVYRTVTRLPGVSSDDYSARFSVRGAKHENVLMLLDGQEMHEPFHVKDVNGGVVSIIDVDAIEGVTLMTGGFSAEYGNRMGGVFDVQSREQEEGKKTLSIGLSMTNFRLLNEGTFAKDKGSWLFVARRGYLDLVLDLMKELESPRPVYYDILSKISYRLTPRQTLSFHVLHAYDKMTFYATDPDGDIDQTTARYDNSYGWLSLQSIFGPKLTARTNVSVARVTRDRWGETSNSILDRLYFRVTDKNTLDGFGLKQDWTAYLADWAQVRWGADLKPASSDYETHTVVVDSTVDHFGVPVLDTVGNASNLNVNGTTFGGYLSTRLRLLRPLTVELGGRFDRASYTHDEDLSPRVGSVLQAGPSTFVRVGWGFYRQMQAMQQLDVQDGVTTFYPSELSRHWTIGIEHKLPSGIELRAEGYHIHCSNPNPSFRNWKNELYQFHNPVEDDRIAVYPSEIDRYGGELYARKTGSRLTWMASYALAFNEELLDSVTANFYDVSYDERISAPSDQRHAIVLGGTYHFSKNWTLNLSWSFHTGWPYTATRIDTVTSGDETVYYLRPARLNAERLPAYSSLNTRISRQIIYQGGELRMFLDVLNLLGQSNVYAVDGELLDSPAAPRLEFEDRTWLSWLPSVGITWTKQF